MSPVPGAPAPKPGSGWRAAWVVIAIALAMVVLILVFFTRRAGERLVPGPEQPVNPVITRLTTNGRAVRAAISRDGATIAFVFGNRGQQSVWVQAASGGEAAQIIPPASVNYLGVAFAPDGNSLYYSVADGGSASGTVFSVPVRGGAARKLLEGAESGITFSPDGARFAYLRSDQEKGLSELFAAGVDGTNPARVSALKLIGGLGGFDAATWSPDGKLIALAARIPDPSGTREQIMVVPAGGGLPKLLASKAWREVSAMTWLSNRNGVLVAARERTGTPRQVWLIPYPPGVPRRVTNDQDDYSSLAATSDSRVFVAVQSEIESNLWVASSKADGTSGAAKQITSGRSDGQLGLAWTHDARIVYTSSPRGNADLWVVSAGGGDPRQLTSDAPSHEAPAVCDTGRAIVFSADRGDAPHLWKMDLDGSNPVQLTSGDGEYYPACAGDGRSVLYTLGTARGVVAKVPVKGGATVVLAQALNLSASISPDERQVAFVTPDPLAATKASAWTMPIELGVARKIFEFPPTLDPHALGVVWTPDGRAIAMIDDRDGTSNIWAQPVAGRAAKRLTDNTGAEQIFRFAWSPDGKQLALARGSESHNVVLITLPR